MHALRMLAMLVVSLTLVLGDTRAALPAGVEQPDQAYAGGWSGTTSQSRPISFTVSGNALTLLEFGFNLPGCGVSGTVEVTYVTPKALSGDTFSDSSNGGPNGVSYTINGTFTSSTTAEGTLDLSYSSTFPFCSTSASTTWTATRSVQVNTIGGTVRDSAGTPVAGATVSATPIQGSPTPITTQSGANGGYSLELPAGSYILTATKAGYSAGQSPVVTVPPDRSAVDLTLTAATFTIGGTVRDDGGAPVAGATVSATPIQASPTPITTQSGANGGYTLELPAGSYILTATKAGYSAGQSPVVTVPPDRSAVDLTLIAATFTISGTVRDSAGTPLAGAEVRATPAQGAPAPITTQSGANGGYTLELPAGSYSLTAAKTGYSAGQSPVVTVPPDRSAVDLTLTRRNIDESSKLYLPLVMVPEPPLKLRTVADTTLLANRPDANYAGTSSLWTGDHRDSCTNDSFDGGTSRGLLRFDLAAVPANRALLKATLHLHAVGLCRNTRSVAPISVAPVTADWAPTSVSWASQPPASGVVGTVDIPLAFESLGWHQIDITQQVQRWASGAEPNYGLLLSSVESADADFAFVAFASSEWTEYAPYIELEFAAPASVAAPAGP